jgi:para-nitrobenzyl esterase
VLQAAQALASDTFIGYSTWHWVDAVTHTGSRPTYFYEFARPRPPLSAQGAAAAAAARAAALESARAQGLEPESMREPRAPRGAVHSTEIEYALDNLDGNPVYAWTREDRQVSALMSAYVANFVKHGDPNGSGLPRWPLYGAGRQMILDVKARSEPVSALQRYQFLERYYAGAAAP